MEWRERSSVSCEEAYLEAQRWVEAVTEKRFGGQNFRSALENGVLLCDLVNKIQPGIIRRVNRLSTPIAGLDNLNVFLKACEKLGLKEAQLFHPGDLQDLSSRVTVKHQETNRRLKNVLITIYWLGRQAFSDSCYDGPYLNLKCFEGLLGTALSKALEECSSPRSSSVRDSGFGDSWYSDREELFQLRGGGGGGGGGGEGRGGGGGGNSKEDSSDSLDSLGSRPHSISSDTTLKGSSEGWCSDAEADSVCVVAMTTNKDSVSYRRSLSVQPKVAAQFNQFLPTKDKPAAYVPAPLRKKRAERNEDNRRSWASPMYTEDDGTFTRSRSMSDITVDPAVAKQVYQEELQKVREQVKESDDKWQDDLTKWKSRRKSVNSDIVKKKEEREQIEQITSGGDGRTRRSLREMREDRLLSRDRSSLGSRLGSLSYLDEDVFDQPVVAPRSRSLHAPRQTADTPHAAERPSLLPSRPADPSPKEAEPAPVAPDRPALSRDAAGSRAERRASPDGGSRATVTTVTNSSSRSSAYTAVSSGAPAPEAAAMPRSASPARERSDADAMDTTAPAAPAAAAKTPTAAPTPEPRSLLPRAPEPWRTTASVRAGERKEAPLYSAAPGAMPPGVSRVSASLPRSTQRPDSTARLTSVVTPRPFGFQANRLSSLTRTTTTAVDFPHRLNGAATATATSDVSKKASVPSRYHQYMTSEDEAPSQSSDSEEEEGVEEEEEEEEEETTVGKGLSAPQAAPRVTSETPAPVAKAASQEEFSDMRISLNQKPNSSRDFGFHADWSASGTRVKSIQPGGAGDASLISTSLDFTSRKSPEGQGINAAPVHAVINVATNGLNGGVHQEPVTMRIKETDPISLKNLKRRSEFFEQGGLETAMPDIPVPALTPSTNRWSWDPEEERRRQEKWQKEQDRLLQEKYKRDQEMLHEAWRKDQEDVADGRQAQKSPAFTAQPTPPWEAQEDEEELRRRQVEQEQQRQAAERRRREEEELELRRLQEERERKEQQEQQQQRRLRQEAEEKERREEEAERLRRAEEIRRRAEEERNKRAEEEERMRRVAEEERNKRAEEEERMRRVAEEERKRRLQGDLMLLRRRDEERQEEERRRAFEQQQQWAKSKSTPEALDEVANPERRVASSEGEQPLRRSQQQLQSQAEQERQQILQEMKKKTQLLTDNSWIRQRSAAAAAAAGSSFEAADVPMRRGESLDNLDGPRNSWRSSWTPGSSSSIPNFTRPQSALYGSGGGGGSMGGGGSYYGGGYPTRPGSISGLPTSSSAGSLRGGTTGTNALTYQQQQLPSPGSPSPATSPETTLDQFGRQQRSRSVSGKKICTLCASPLGKGAAMIIESLGLCYHLSCFKCTDCKSDLGGSEAGAEVRIRNKQLYCNSCYQRFKTGQPTSM